MPVREKATKGPGSRASRPFSRPRPYATRRETAGLSAYSRGIHCRERLTAGGKWIRTPSPTSQATYGGGRISAKNKAGLPSQAGPKERKRASKGLTRASAKVGAVLGGQHSDFAGADRARSGQSEDVTLLPSGRREAEEPLTVAVVSAPPHSMRSASRRAPLRFHRSRPASLRRLFVREPGAQAPKPRNRRQSTSKATTAPTSRRLPASVARTRWDASERLWARRPVPRRLPLPAKRSSCAAAIRLAPFQLPG
jgi:hypothetical protein